MTCAIMPPLYLPELSYFDLIDQADTFVFLDDVTSSHASQVVDDEYKSRVKIVGISDKSIQNNSGINFCDGTESLVLKNLENIDLQYSNHSYFNQVFPFLWEIYNQPFKSDIEFNINLIELIAFKIGIRSQFYRSSRMSIQFDLDFLDVISKTCSITKCSNFLAPENFSKNVAMNTIGSNLNLNNIGLYLQTYSHPLYNQLKTNQNNNFQILDLLFCVGFDDARAIIKKGRTNTYYYEHFVNRSA